MAKNSININEEKRGNYHVKANGIIMGDFLDSNCSKEHFFFFLIGTFVHILTVSKKTDGAGQSNNSGQQILALLTEMHGR